MIPDKCPTCGKERTFYMHDQFGQIATFACNGHATFTLAGELASSFCPTARIAELEAELADRLEVDKSIMSEKCDGPYEMHCSCVPTLRVRIAELEGLLREAVPNLKMSINNCDDLIADIARALGKEAPHAERKEG